MNKVNDWLKPGAIVPVDVNTTKELVDALRELMKPKAIYHGGPAFPTEAYDIERQTIVREEGLTMRDYFASKAMPVIYQEWLDNHWNLFEHAEACESIASQAYLIADAMLKARNK